MLTSMYTPTRCIQQLSTLRRTLPTRQAFVSPKCCGTLQCAHHFSRMRGRVHFGEFGPGIFSGPNLQSAPRFCKVRRQSVRVRGGFLQSAHFAESAEIFQSWNFSSNKEILNCVSQNVLRFFPLHLVDDILFYCALPIRVRQYVGLIKYLKIVFINA